MIKCKVCEKSGYVIDTKKFPKDFCSYSCYEQWQKFNKTPNCECTICKCKMYIKESRLKKVKNGITCSKECANVLKSDYMSGDKNHQFGLIGELNDSFKGQITISNYGYILEYCPNHPYPHDRYNKTTRVFQHRLIIEKNYKLFDINYFELIDNDMFLKQEYIVHHINEDKKDNRIENLQILTKNEHSKLHTFNKEIIRDDIGRIIGVSKSDKLLENPVEGNQQPIVNLND